MSNGFEHSEKVPRLYKVSANTVRNVKEKGESLKQLIYERKHPNLGGTYALALTTLKHGSQLDELVRKTQILVKEPRLDPWLARILITELLWGKQCLKSNAKPIRTVLTYETQLREESKCLGANVDASVETKVQKPRYVRINTLLKSVDESIRSFTDEGLQLLPKSQDYSSFLASLSELDKWTFVQDFHIPELFAFAPRTHFYDHPGYQSGAIVLQDKASCFPAYLLNPDPGSTVIDMCAAPGMKTTHLAAIMKNTGKIFAVELDQRRYRTLCEFVEAAGADCVKTINADSMTLDSKQCPNVEYILVDPSCSGSGMLDRMNFEDTASKCAPGRLRSLRSFQVFLLRHALFSFPTVKRVVYSTCSIYPEENEMVVDEILEDVGEAYTLVSVKKLLKGNWKNFSSNDYKCKDKCLYAKSEIDLTNGFFVAVFERNFDVPLPEFKRKKRFIEQTASVEENGEGGDGENPNGKKRKKKKSTEDGCEAKTMENTVEIAPTNTDEQLRKKKRKKKDKLTEHEKIQDDESITEIQCVTNENGSPDGQPTKKKRKKKDKSTEHEKIQDDESITEIQCVTNENGSPDEQLTKKKRKKKDKSTEHEQIQDDESIIEIQCVTNENKSPDDEKIKKKKRAFQESKDTKETREISDSLPTEERKIKKKKKKRNKNDLDS